jgi:hypothetical protein
VSVKVKVEFWQTGLGMQEVRLFEPKGLHPPRQNWIDVCVLLGLFRVATKLESLYSHFPFRNTQIHYSKACSMGID